MGASAAIDDDSRVARLQALAALDSGRELIFDRLVFTVAQIVRVPIALISLADKRRHWFKSQVGLSIDELPRGMALCEALLEGGSSLVVEDLSVDGMFSDHPLVTGPLGLRFFAAVPLVARDGLRLGTLCIADRVTRTLPPRQILQLQGVAASVVLALEARRLPDA